MNSDNLDRINHTRRIVCLIGIVVMCAFPTRTVAVSPDDAAVGILSSPSQTSINLHDAVSAPRIKDIRIHDAFPVFDKNVLNVMTISVGDVWASEKLGEQKPLIETVFASHGFKQARIDLTGHPDARDGHVIVDVHIQPGPFIRIQQVDLEGVSGVSAAHLKIRLITWQRSMLYGSSNRLIDSDIQKDIRELTDYFRKERYLDVTVTHSIETKSETDRVLLKYHVTEGPLYRLDWSGNQAFSASVLSDDLTFLKNTRPGASSISQSIRLMKKRYRQAGYLSPQIQIQLVDSSGSVDPEKRIQIQIDEGPFTQVTAIRFSGNHQIPISELSGAMLTRTPGLLNKGPLNPDRLDEDMLAIQSLYLTQGFLNTSAKYDITTSSDHRAEIQVTIEEGIQTRVDAVRINGLSVISTEAALATLKLQTHQPFRPYMVESDRNTLSEIISKTGRPHVSITDSLHYSPGRDRVEIVYQVNEGPAVQTGQVVFVGNFRTRQAQIEDIMTIKPGEPFSLTQVLEDLGRLRDMEIFDTVQVQTIGLSEKAPVVDILVSVEEKKPYRIEAGAGYETEKGTFLHSRAQDINFMGRDIAAKIDGEASEIGYEFSATLTDPRIFNSLFSASAGFYAEEIAEFNQTYGTRSLGTTLSFNRKWKPRIETGLILQIENRSVYSTEDDALVFVTDEFGNILEVTDRSFASLAHYIQYDSRDSLIRPKKGIYANLSIEPTKGFDTDLDDFIRVKGDLRGLVSPLPRLTLAAMIKAGYLNPLNESGMVSTDQLLYLGGASTVRGFEENLLRRNELGNPVGGRSSLCGSLEGRIDLVGNLELTLFVDAGRLSDLQTAGVSDDVRFSAGLGLRYITPIGPMGLVYGYKLNREPGESAGRIHIAIGYTF